MEAEPTFKNEGEHAAYETKLLFQNEYKPQQYEKYKGTIIANKGNYRYGSLIVSIGNNAVLKAIFDNGLFYPDIISVAFKYEPKLELNKDSLIAWAKEHPIEKPLFPFKIDTLFITDFNEMKFVETSPKQKRFEFWLFTKGFANPTEYYLELTNKNANAKTDSVSFVKGSQRTYFKNGGIII